MSEYRILERRTDGDWTPFGVAYEREGRIVLFAPPWRADRELEVASLEELDERHCPSEEFRWREVETTIEPLPHPIALLQRALDSQPAEDTIRAQLMVALSHLAVARQDLSGRLLAWREELERGAAICAEAVLRAILMPEQDGTVEVLPTLSHNSLEFSYAGAGLRSKGGQPSDEAHPDEASRTNLIVLTTNDLPGAKVAVSDERVTVTFLDWQAPLPPLVALVPEEGRGVPQMAELMGGESGNWTARFTHLPVGKYLLAVAPVSR